MKPPRLSQDDFIRLFQELGPAELARRQGTDTAAVFHRRTRTERRLGITIKGPDHRNSHRFDPDVHPERICVSVKDAIVLVCSDEHYWPGIISTGHRAFVYFCRVLKPTLVITNGDVIDAQTIGRYPPIGWEYRPTLASEVEAAQERLKEIRDAAKGARFIWPIGNHDARFNTRLAIEASEYAKIKGVHLKDHFPYHEPCWSVHINQETNGWTEIKHRWKGGIHAAFNNAKESGVHFVTGHDHSLNVVTFTNRRQTLFGIDTGTLANPNGPQFVNYTESNPKNWRQGFQVLTYNEMGELLWPETVFVSDDKHGIVQFRGKEWKV